LASTLTSIFENVLLKPAKNANELFIVSGYATPAMALYHATSLKNSNLSCKVSLVLGMCIQEGLARSQHLGFKQLVQADLKDRFTCAYVRNPPPVHSKVYVWCSWGTPVAAFVGRANYSQAAFQGGTREFMVEYDPQKCYDYYRNLVDQTIYCEHPEAEDDIVIYDDRTFEYRAGLGPLTPEIVATESRSSRARRDLPCRTISLLDEDGNLPQRSGLNWGQREHREPNQAYIRIPIDIAREPFFPERGIPFTVLTDDDMTLICTRAQDEAKAIETPQNNSLLGLYFRRRMGLPDGSLVTKQDLLNYGRTDVTFCRIDPETYLMNFSPPADR
jgi:hypothetical protein